MNKHISVRLKGHKDVTSRELEHIHTLWNEKTPRGYVDTRTVKRIFKKPTLTSLRLLIMTARKKEIGSYRAIEYLIHHLKVNPYAKRYEKLIFKTIYESMIDSGFSEDYYRQRVSAWIKDEFMKDEESAHELNYLLLDIFKEVKNNYVRSAIIRTIGISKDPLMVRKLREFSFDNSSYQIMVSTMFALLRLDPNYSGVSQAIKVTRQKYADIKRTGLKGLKLYVESLKNKKLNKIQVENLKKVISTISAFINNPKTSYPTKVSAQAVAIQTRDSLYENKQKDVITLRKEFDKLAKK